MTQYSNPLLKKSKRRLGDTNFRGGKVALDAVLETIDQEKLPEQDYTTQNGKMMGKGTEVEEGSLDDAIPATLLASQEYRHPEQDNIIREMLSKMPDPKPLTDNERAVLSEMMRRRGSINGNTVNDLTDAVKPGVPELPLAEDATFFKESDGDFEVTRVAGRLLVADTKSYGAGTPNGGTPSAAPAASTAPPAPGAPASPATAPPVNNVPPVSSVNKTPQQLSQEAMNPPAANGGALTQQQLDQVLNAVKGAGIEMKKSPTMLPPRDDMRRHLDKGVMDEVKEGIKEPTPAATAPKPQQPEQKQWQTRSQDTLLNQALASKSAGVEPEYVTLTRKIIADLTRLAQIAPQGEDIAGLADMDSHDLQYFLDIDLKNMQQPVVPASKVGVQTEDDVHHYCPGCSGQNFKKFDSDAEDGSLVECLDCGCFFAY